MSRTGVSLRHRFRWANGVGFALTLFFALWGLVFLTAQLQARFTDLDLPMPLPFALVAGVTLVAAVGFLGWVLLGYAWQGLDLGESRPRALLFAWTCAGGLFFLSQTLALLRFGGGVFPHLPSWFATLYWYFCVIGAVTFLVLLWVNAEVHAIRGDEGLDAFVETGAEAPWERE